MCFFFRPRSWHYEKFRLHNVRYFISAATRFWFIHSFYYCRIFSLCFRAFSQTGNINQRVSVFTRPRFSFFFLFPLIFLWWIFIRSNTTCRVQFFINMFIKPKVTLYTLSIYTSYDCYFINLSFKKTLNTGT